MNGDQTFETDRFRQIKRNRLAREARENNGGNSPSDNDKKEK